jgi:hypothetical protein
MAKRDAAESPFKLIPDSALRVVGEIRRHLEGRRAAGVVFRTAGPAHAFGEPHARVDGGGAGRSQHEHGH